MSKRKVGDVFFDLAGNRCTVRENGFLRVETLNEDPSLTIQSEKDNCDINKILSNFNSTGIMMNVAKGSPIEGDFTNVSDYQSALNSVVAAQESFNALPAKIRARFENDPGQLISFLEDPQNRSEAIELGLLPKVADVPPQDAQIPQGEAQPAPEGAV